MKVFITLTPVTTCNDVQFIVVQRTNDCFGEAFETLSVHCHGPSSCMAHAVHSLVGLSLDQIDAFLYAQLLKRGVLKPR